MARPSKLTVAQCTKARELHTTAHIPVPRLAKRFKVSESSMYKVLDGSYHAREGVSQRSAGSSQSKRHRSNQMPAMTPNLFPDVPALGTQAGDDILVEAARLIVARSRFASMLRH